MLERNVSYSCLSQDIPHVHPSLQPNKDKILAKHEFSGNRPGLVLEGASNSGAGPSHLSLSGRGGGRGRGRGGAQRGGGGGGGADGAHARAWKDKNKASRGNHNRKRGHDKKMARAGAPPA